MNEENYNMANQATYDECIEYLTKNPDGIGLAWNRPRTRYGRIFSFLGCDRVPNDFYASKIGCPTLIKSSHQAFSPYSIKLFAINEEITNEVLNDPLIPSDIDELLGFSEEERRVVLTRFKYYQEKVDALCGR